MSNLTMPTLTVAFKQRASTAVARSQKRAPWRSSSVTPWRPPGPAVYANVHGTDPGHPGRCQSGIHSPRLLRQYQSA